MSSSLLIDPDAPLLRFVLKCTYRGRGQECGKEEIYNKEKHGLLALSFGVFMAYKEMILLSKRKKKKKKKSRRKF